jgi:hypothetical protein
VQQGAAAYPAPNWQQAAEYAFPIFMTLDREWERLPEHALLLSGFNEKKDDR